MPQWWMHAILNLLTHIVLEVQITDLHLNHLEDESGQERTQNVVKQVWKVTSLVIDCRQPAGAIKEGECELSFRASGGGYSSSVS